MLIGIKLYSTEIHNWLLLFLSVSGAGDLSRGSLVVAHSTNLLVMEMMPSGRHKTPRQLVTGERK